MSTNTILELVGKVVRLEEVHAAVKTLGYEMVAGCLSGFDGHRKMAMVGDWRYKRPDNAAIVVEVQGMCDHCARPLDRWANWWQAKENGDMLNALCADDHLTTYDQNGDKAKVRVIAVRML